MPRIDFSTVEDAKAFTPLPEGQYVAEVSSVEETTTNRGEPMWKLRLKVLEGPHAGRFLFDNLVFSPKALKRVKFVCARLGLDTTGEVDLTPRLLRGRTARVTVTIEDYIDDEGKARSRNSIPFAGYESVAEEATAAEEDEDDAPF